MKKFLLQLLSLVISTFAGGMMAQAQSSYEPYPFGMLGGLAENPNSTKGARVTGNSPIATGTTSAPTPTPSCTDAWVRTSTTNAPTGRYSHTAVWTGSEMIVWGGLAFSGIPVDTGGRYNPSTDSWVMTATMLESEP